MTETVFSKCNKFFAHKDDEVVFTGKQAREFFTSLSTGEQFCVKKFAVFGIEIYMSDPGKTVMTKLIANRILQDNPGQFDTKDLKKFKRSLPLPTPGFYLCDNVIIQVFHDTIVKFLCFTEQNTKMPRWLGRKYMNPAQWWAKKPQRLKHTLNYYWGTHPDRYGYNVITVKQEGVRQTYIHGKERSLSDSEVYQLIQNNVFHPLTP